MSSGFSGNKEKRSRSSSEANNSFVKNVTSRVSGLLPSTITKWFSSPSSSNANGSAAVAESTDSSTEDEALESPITSQPPAKRMRYSSPGSSNHYNLPDTKCTSTNTESIDTYNTIQSPAGRSTFRPETNFASTPLQGSNDESTMKNKEKDSSIYNLQNSLSSIGHSIVKKRKSLFDVPHSDRPSEKASSTSNAVRDLNQPSFKPSLLGSPFYPGRTMYGGAASSYMNQPNIKNKKDTLVNETSSNDSITISHSARRVMDLLENYSSPLIEAKRLSQLVRSPKNNSINSSMDTSMLNSSKGLSYKTQELHVPSIATILRLKQKSRLMDTTSAARQIIASHSSSVDYTPYPVPKPQSNDPKDTSEKLTTKIKSRLTRINRDDKVANETNIPEPVNLPTAVLQIDQNNLPKFSFGTTPFGQSSTGSQRTITADTDIKTSAAITFPKTISKEAPITKTNDVTHSKPESVSIDNNFKFSTPVRICNDSLVNPKTPPKFTFGSPERTLEKAKETEKDSEKPSFVLGDQTKTDGKMKAVAQSDNWKCNDCWVSNKAEAKTCVCCGGKKPIKDDTKCTNSSENKSNNIDKAKPKTSSTDLSNWKCQDCWVNNDEGSDKCVCCGGKNPSKTATAATSTMTSFTPIKINNIENDWTCGDCWIKNKSNIDKCAACGGAKPVSSHSKSSPSITLSKTVSNSSNNSTFKNILKSQTAKWECGNCLVRNDNDKSKCVCCDTEKPGTIKESDKKSFNFGINPNTSFKFGIDPKQNISEKKNEFKPITPIAPIETVTSVAETNNNILSKTQTFTFGVPKKTPEEKSTKEEEIKTSTTKDSPKSAFTFGIPKQISTVPVTTNSVSSPVFTVTPTVPKVTDTTKEKEEKPQEVPNVVQLKPEIKLPEISQKPLELFSSPLSQQSSINKPVMSNLPALNSLNSLEKPTISANTLSKPAPTTAEPPKATQNTFTFAASGIKPAINLFSPPATTTTTSTLPFQSVQAPAPSSTLSFFQKSEPVSTSTTSFFQNNESKSTTLSLFKKSETATTTATATAPTISSNAPVFSFGSGAQNTAKPTETPKFNFTFGSGNKTDGPSLFKTPFGGTPDTNIRANKFTLSTSNSLSGNALGGNTLGGGNTLSSGNALSGNILSGGSNPLGGLSGSSGLGTANTLGGNDLTSNSLTSSNTLTSGNAMAAAPTGGIFGQPVQKENMWSSSNNTASNLFVSNSATTALQKPATFTFGTSTPFNSNSTASAFGTPSQPSQSLFGMPNQSSNTQSSLFSNPLQPSSTANLFGAPQSASNPAPTVGMFGTPNVGSTPTFGSTNTTFETPAMNPTPAPAFNFGAQQQNTGIFGFTQQQQQQPQAGGVYNFGASGVSTPQVQFNMGSAPNTGRKVRRAVRRTCQR